MLNNALSEEPAAKPPQATSQAPSTKQTTTKAVNPIFGSKLEYVYFKTTKPCFFEKCIIELDKIGRDVLHRS
jgi:hypothetical protein